MLGEVVSDVLAQCREADGAGQRPKLQLVSKRDQVGWSLIHGGDCPTTNPPSSADPGRSSEGGRGRRRYETNQEAYDLYLHARASMTRLFPGNDEVTGLFEKAIARDSSLAPAYAGLATAYAWRSFSNVGDPNR